MNEYITDAWILDYKDSGETDRLVSCYTSRLGKVLAKAKSARKITSKLAGHLEPFSLAKIRLVEKNGFQVVDALRLKKIIPEPELAKFFWFINAMTPELQPDKKLWLAIKKSLTGTNPQISYPHFLEILGFATQLAKCSGCGSKKISYFSVEEQNFICGQCALGAAPDMLILI